MPTAHDRLPVPEPGPEPGDVSGPAPALRPVPVRPAAAIGGGALDAFFAPRSVALAGASERVRSVGAAVAANLLGGAFAGEILFVNPRHRRVFGRPCVASVSALHTAPDLGVIATPAATVPGLVADFAARGTRACVILSAGLDAAACAAIRSTAMQTGMRLLGPNCIGLIAPHAGLNASFAPLSPKPGRLAFLSQSGAILTSVLDWAVARDIGFSAMVSIGNAVDVDLAALIDHFAADPETEGVLLYLESVRDGATFRAAAARCQRIKPVIAMKVGRHAEGARAALSHTGALAGSDIVYDAAFRAAGILRVEALEDLFDAAEMLSRPGTAAAGKAARLAILTNGGGAGVIAADALADRLGKLATLSPATVETLDRLLPAAWSRANPVDIVGDADAARYQASVEAVLADPAVDALIVMMCPTSLAAPRETAEAVIAAVSSTGTTSGGAEAGGAPMKPVMTAWLGEATVAPARALFEAAGIPTFASPEDAVAAFSHMTAHRHARSVNADPGPDAAFAVDAAAVRRALGPALAEGTSLVDPAAAAAVLSACGIPVVETTLCPTPAEAGRRVGEILAMPGSVRACVLKIVSPDIAHKSDVGGVVTGLRSAGEAEAAAERMIARLARERPRARITGFAVQPMVEGHGGHELIVGLYRDPTFGPVILFGAGGTAVEVLDDKAVDLPPIDRETAEAMIARTRIARLLAGYRDRPPARRAAIVDTILRLGRLALAVPEIAELDINPLRTDADGVLALDARIVLAVGTKVAADGAGNPARAALV